MTIRTERSASFRFTHFVMGFAFSLGIFAASASAATIQVDVLSDEADGILVGGVSLRDAINEANDTPGPDIIAIGIEGTITLGADLPIVTSDIEVRGDEAGVVVINGNGQFRAFVIQNPSATVTIRNITIENCLTFPGDVSGATGGISTGAAILLLSGRLIVDSTRFVDNTASGGSGGAIYASGGRLELIACTFERNAAIGGIAGDGGVTSVGGHGGALYVGADAAAFGAELQFGSGSDSNWATHDANAIGDDDDIFGTVRALPVVLSILRLGVSRTRLDEVTYVVAFSESVSGVDATDFSLVTTGVSGAAITSVEAVIGSTYAVTIATGAGSGTIALQLNDDDSIRNMESLSLGGVGTGNGDFLAEAAFSIDRTRPRVSSIDAEANSASNSSEITFVISFSEPVTDFDDAGDVHIEHAGTIHDAIEFTQISDATYEVALSGVTGEGTIRLFVKAGAAADFVGNPSLVDPLGAAIAFDDVRPTIESIDFLDEVKLAERAVFTIRFSEPISGLTADGLIVSHAGTQHDELTIREIDERRYRIELLGVQGVGEISITLRAGSLTDQAGLTNVEYRSEAVAVDATPPMPVAEGLFEPLPPDAGSETSAPAASESGICGTGALPMMGLLSAFAIMTRRGSRRPDVN